MKIALISDIHGNSIALDAVLADIKAQGDVDEYWVLGDHCAFGFDPVGVIQRLLSLPNARFTYGNADLYILTDQYPSPNLEQAEQDASKVKLYGDVQRSIAWTQGAVAGAGLFGWLESLPLEQRLTLPDERELLGVHSAPGKVDGFNFCVAYPEEDMRALLVGESAELIVVGHIHWPFNRQFEHNRVVVTGAVGNPFRADMRAKYVILEATEQGYSLTFRYVPYDYAEVVVAIERSRHASPEFLLLFARGQYDPSWLRDYSDQEQRDAMPFENHPYFYPVPNLS